MQANNLELELDKFITIAEYADKPSYHGFVGDYSGYDDYKKHLQNLFDEYFADITMKLNSLVEKGKISFIHKFINHKIDTFQKIEKNFMEKYDPVFLDGKMKQLYEDIKEHIHVPMPPLYYGYWNKYAYKLMATIQIDYIKKTITQLTFIRDTDYPEVQISVTTSEIPYFTRSFTKEERRKIFDDLLKERCLPQETDYSHFCFVFGGIEIPSEKPFEPLRWQRTIALLAYFVDNMFGDTDSKRLWEITSNCFIKGNDRPNKDSLKNIVSKIKSDFKNKPKGYETIDKITI